MYVYTIHFNNAHTCTCTCIGLGIAVGGTLITCRFPGVTLTVPHWEYTLEAHVHIGIYMPSIPHGRCHPVEGGRDICSEFDAFRHASVFRQNLIKAWLSLACPYTMYTYASHAPQLTSNNIMCFCCQATEVSIGNLLATWRGWVIIK